MKNLVLLIALVVSQVSGFSQKINPVVKNPNNINGIRNKTITFVHDLTLIKPLINTNDSNGGYYSEYFYFDFNYMYCGAVIKNSGTASATHVYLEMKIMDWSSTVLNTYYSDTIGLLNPGEVVTVNIPGQLTFQSWNNIIDHFIFMVKSDSVDENPVNDQEIVPFTRFYYYNWTNASRSIYMTTSYDIGQSGNFHSGDFLGFTLSTPTNWHWLVYIEIYIAEPWQDSLALTAMVYRNGQLLDTAQVYLPDPPQAGWVGAGIFEPWPFLDPDSLYYIGVKISYNAGTHLKIGTDTSAYHNFGAESIAKIGGSWFTLNYVPLIQLVCDPEGIPDLTNQTAARVFPNPVMGTLFIDNVKGSKIEIYDITGKLVLTDTQTSSSRKLDVSDLASGIYLLRIISKDRIDSRKILVK
jgi:hypothetical protein